ncbi:hypothetical protein GOBAR_DD29162 [Gossypium barbadense]|nr:hypothetical protein GOBAR_DD29162 [Gossypium barbadense]
MDSGFFLFSSSKSRGLLRLQSLDGTLRNHKQSMSTLEIRGPSLRGYRRRKAVLDLNVPPSEIREQEGTSQQAGYEDQTNQSIQTGPPATIDVEAIDDDVIESSARAFAEAQNNSRRSRGRTVVDVDSAHISALPGWSARSSNNNQNRHRRLPPSSSIINLEISPQSIVQEITKPQPPPKEPTFNCPICMGPLTEEMSTRCGHIFCKACIKAAITTQAKCPTCRKRVTVKELIRVKFSFAKENRKKGCEIELYIVEDVHICLMDNTNCPCKDQKTKVNSSGGDSLVIIRWFSGFKGGFSGGNVGRFLCLPLAERLDEARFVAFLSSPATGWWLPWKVWSLHGFRTTARHRGLLLQCYLGFPVFPLLIVPDLLSQNVSLFFSVGLSIEEEEEGLCMAPDSKKRKRPNILVTGKKHWGFGQGEKLAQRLGRPTPLPHHHQRRPRNSTASITL